MIAAIGAFDGYHRGHTELLRAASDRASSTSKDWCVLTFSREDGRVLGRKGVRSLFTNREQLLLESFFKIPRVERITFTHEIESMSPEIFLDHIATSFGVDGIVVGQNFRFGKNRSGDALLLSAECERRGWSFDPVPTKTTPDGMPISSSSVRQALYDGDMRRAELMLGHPYFCAGRVVHGNERGRLLGFPTANIDIPPEKAPMPYGVYACAVYASGGWYLGAANVGMNPTFDDVPATRFEVNIFDFTGSLYGEEILVFMLERVRGEIRFGSPEDLVRQIETDTIEIKDICGRSEQMGQDIRDRFARAAANSNANS